MEHLIECKQRIFSYGSAWKQPIRYNIRKSDQTGKLKKTIDGRVDAQPNTKSIQTILLPLADIGGKSGFKETLTFLRKMDGVTGANLFFGGTAVCIHYDPNLTNINIIFTILKTMSFGFNDDPSFQDMPVKGVVNI